MSEQTSTQDHPATESVPSAELRTTHDGTAQPARSLVLAAVCLGVAAMAAAAFVLSYSGIHAVAIQAGISSQHAKDYPALIDAMLVITLLAVLGLRGAGLPSRTLSWFALLCVLAAAAGADVLHATGRMLRHTAGAATAAVLPWALVFITFVLLLALLRHARLRRQAGVARQQSNPLATDANPAYADRPIGAPAPPSLPVRTPRARDSASIVPGFSARLVSSAAAGAAAGAAEPPGPVPDADDYAPGDADRGQDDTVLGLAGADETDTREGAESAAAEPTDADATPADPPAQPAEPADADATPADPPATDSDIDGLPTDTGSLDTFPAQDDSDDPGTSGPAAAGQGADDVVADNMPVFHRMWSTPTPPDS
jgi:Protein of unknown function (DUF2637)